MTANKTACALPLPEPSALTHSLELTMMIRKAIAENGGALDFSQYMQMALYTPELGYYNNGAVKFGQDGDFTTAPELSILYSRCIARQCRQILEQPSYDNILEIGSGTGAMAIAILTELEQLDCLPKSYLILEPSSDLRQKQQQLLQQKIPHLAERVRWLAQLPTRRFSGLILANEVLDAMPVTRFCIYQGALCVRCVTYEEEQFCWCNRPPEDTLSHEVKSRIASLPWPLPDLYVAEINMHIKSWLKSLAEVLDRGIILFADYGYPRAEYFHPQRTEGNLICHYQHRAHTDPFWYPGLQDISAAVDFTAVAEAAAAADLEIAGFTTQAHFLIACGMLEMLIDGEHDDLTHAEMKKQARNLTMPGEMGEKFKLIALTKATDTQLCGFDFVDQKARL